MGRPHSENKGILTRYKYIMLHLGSTREAERAASAFAAPCPSMVEQDWN